MADREKIIGQLTPFFELVDATRYDLMHPGSTMSERDIRRAMRHIVKDLKRTMTDVYGLRPVSEKGHHANDSLGT